MTRCSPPTWNPVHPSDGLRFESWGPRGMPWHGQFQVWDVVPSFPSPHGGALSPTQTSISQIVFPSLQKPFSVKEQRGCAQGTGFGRVRIPCAVLASVLCSLSFCKEIIPLGFGWGGRRYQYWGAGWYSDDLSCSSHRESSPLEEEARCALKEVDPWHRVLIQGRGSLVGGRKAPTSTRTSLSWI